MKKIISLLLLSFSQAHSDSKEAQNINNINVHNDNKPNITQSVVIQNNLTSLLEYIKTNISKDKIKKEIEEQVLTIWNFTYKYIKIHKRKMVIGIIGGTYAFIFSSLLYLEYKILQHNTWASWKETIPSDMLQVIPHQELGKELLYAIQQQYQTPKNLTDFFTPLILFLHDVDQELAVLSKFLTLHTWIETLRLSTLFPHQENLIENAHEKIRRLEYLKEVFIHWVTDYKITLNTSHQEA